MELEGLGLANHSNLGGAAFGSSAVAAHRVAVVDGGMHCHKTDQGEAERSDDLLVCRLSHKGSSAADLQFQHCVTEAFFYAALADAEAPGDLFCGQSSGNL